MRAFISHASADKPLVRKIDKRLREGGVETWIDEARIRVGQSIPGEVSEGLRDSDLLILVMSVQAVASPWVEREFSAFVMTALGQRKPILPCRVDDCTVPVLISDIKYADFRKSFSLGMAGLLGAVSIAEEVALTQRAEAIALELSSVLTPEERVRCTPSFSTTKGWPLNIFALPEGRVRVIINLLKAHNLIWDTEEGDGFLKSTELGLRVFAIWDA